jgi:hypothetical protein
VTFLKQSYKNTIVILTKFSMFSKVDCQDSEKTPTSYYIKRKNFEVITSIEEKFLVIFIACMSGARKYVPLMIIFPRVNFSNF